MAAQLDLRAARKLTLFVSFCSMFSIAVGLVGLAGWVFQIEILKTVFPGLVAIKANTAVCFVLIGFSLWWLGTYKGHSRSISSWIAKAAAALVGIVGLLSFLEFLVGRNFRIDQLLFVETTGGAIGSIRPGLMSPITAIAFVLLGLALLLVDWTRSCEASPGQYLSFGAGLISLFTFLDFIVQPHGSHAGIALQTAIALCLLSLGVMCSRPERGFVGALVNSNLRFGTVRGLWTGALSDDGPVWRMPLRHGLAVLLVFLATVLRYIPGGFLPESLIYITYYPATMIAALVGGLGPGIVATLLSDVCIDYFFLEPKGQFGNKGLPDLIGLIVFTLIGIGMSWLSGAVNRTKKQAADETRRAKEEWERTFDSVPEAVMVLDPEFRIQRANRAMTELLALQPETLLGKHCFELVHNRTSPVPDCPLRRMLQSGKQEQQEIVEPRLNKVFDVSATPLWEGGSLRGCVHVIRDITERRRVQEQLRKSSLYARNLLEASLDPLVTISREGKITDVNEATEKVTGVSREQLIGSDFCDYFTDPESARRGYEQVFAQGSVQDYPLAIRSTSGKVTDVLYNATVFKNEAGEVEGVFAAARDVTERKLAEQALNRSEIRYRSLVAATAQIVWTTNPQGEVVDDMPTWRAFTGMSLEQIQGSGWIDSLHPDDREQTREIWSKAVRERSLYDTEYRVRRRDGEYRMCAVRGVPVLESDGKIREWVGTCTDITERKCAEEQLRKASLYTRSLIEASLDPLVTISREGKITDVNEATEMATGVSRDRLIGSDFSNYFTEPESARRGYEQVFAQGSVQDYPLAIRSTSGKVTDVLYNATVFKNQAGEAEGVFAAARDITERKRAQEAVAAEREKFNNILDVLPPYVVLLTPDYHVAFANREFKKRFGESNGRRCFEFLFDRTEPCEICETYKVLQAKKALEWKWIGPDGCHYDIYDFPFTDTDGSSLILEMGIDVTDRRRAEEEVRRLNEELEQRVIQRTAQLEAANKELEAFTYSVSHDLRAPLRHISGFSKILAEEYGSSLVPDAQHHLRRIQEGTRRMGLLVDDLLNLGRIGRHEVRLQVTGLKSIVNEVVEELKPECAGRQVEWKLDTLPFVECDPALMRQVFQNLLSNALKFTRPRSQAVIEVGQKDHDGTPVVFVRDNGVGFNIKYADKLFGVFQRLHRVEDFEGTGVGLATVQRIIQKHGGRIWAEAELDKGATFFFTLGTSEKTELKTIAATVGDKA